MEERHFSTLVSLLGEDVLSDDCLVVVTGGNDDKNQNQNQQFERERIYLAYLTRNMVRRIIL